MVWISKRYAFEAGDGLVPPVQFFLDGVVLLVEGVFGCFDLFDQFVELFFAIFCFFLFGDDIDWAVSFFDFPFECVDFIIDIFFFVFAELFGGEDVF